MPTDIALVIDNTCQPLSEDDCSAYKDHITDFISKFQVSDDVVRMSLNFYADYPRLDVGMMELNDRDTLRTRVDSAIGNCDFDAAGSDEQFSDALVRAYDSLDYPAERKGTQSLVFFSACDTSGISETDCVELAGVSGQQPEVTFVTVASGDSVRVNTDYESFCFPQSTSRGGYIFENPDYDEQQYMNMVEQEEDVVCRTLAPTSSPTENPTRNPTGMYAH